MIDKVELQWGDIADLSIKVGEAILGDLPSNKQVLNLWGVPRGGTHAAQAVAERLRHDIVADRELSVRMVTNPFEADVIIDDIIDSGSTRDKIVDTYGRPFYALTEKSDPRWEGKWVEFPWEGLNSGEGHGIEENIRRIIQYIGDDPKREGLLETPGRVIRSYSELFSGYQYKTDEDIAALFKTFEDGACDEMVLVTNIEFNSFCEHHMLPFQGVAHVAYLPNKKIVGLSKLARIVDAFSKRLQVQERLTIQITSAINKHLEPRGSACMIEAKHSCMSCRGVMKQQSSMVTSSLTGAFLDGIVRQEFYSLINRS